MATDVQIPILTGEEIRVLGALIEKSKTTPDYYPMTLNSLTAACNQKSARWPVVEYDEGTVVVALNSLKGQSLVATAVGGGSRVIKYKHNFTTVYPISDAELAILCLLFLRGPLTPGEINSNAGRLFQFSSLESVLENLQRMSSSHPSFVKEVTRRSGQKENRFMHLLGGDILTTDEETTQEPARKNVSDLESRLTKVEQELSEMKAILEKITSSLF